MNNDVAKHHIFSKEKPLSIIAIAAIGERTRAIGMKGELLWKLPGDLLRFKEITMGHPLLMGRTTFESIGRPLPGRTNIVLTHNHEWTHNGVVVVHSLEEVIAKAAEHDSVLYVIGGGKVYEHALSVTDTLLLTLVRDDAQGDTFFPPYEVEFHERTQSQWVEQDNTPPFRYSRWERTR